ncbi:MAG: alpha/beta hydrolase family protein [Reyranella sp.]|uniref:alpha/beta hydrolase family protein n=1 Tax=Reyranella sp. TaxID=1929291 RepID=UPI003D1276FD
MRSLAVAVLALLGLALLARGAASADPDYAAPGPFTIRQIDETWTDDSRQRDIPLRIRLPESREPVPVIVFSHGLGGSRDGGREWGEHWASRGFAVIHVQHPGSDEALWKDKPAGERFSGLRSGATLQQFLARIADIKFVVADLGRRQSAGDPLAARLNLDRLGMSGHSFGAVTTLFLGGQRPAPGIADRLAVGLPESRFSAFLAFSPQALGADPEHQFAAFRRPALLITGTLDGRPFPGLGATVEQRMVPFASMPATGNKFFLVIDRADHMYFNGTRGLRDLGVGGRETIDFATVEARGYTLIKAVSTAYWLAYLRNDGGALGWLKGGEAASLVAGDGNLEMK